MNKVISILLTLLSISHAQAQPEINSDHAALINYTVKVDDTWQKIATSHLKDPKNISQVKHLNSVTNLASPIPNRTLRIPKSLVKEMAAQARVIHLACAVPVRFIGLNQALAIGSVVHEGAVIDVPADCNIALLLEDGSTIRLPSSATLVITRLRKNTIEPTAEVKLDLARGRVDLGVFKGRTSTTPFDVRTPLSVMGVRGTEFRAGYAPEAGLARVEVLSGVVQTQGIADKQSVNITKGQGVPINASGTRLATEQLLPPPSYVAAKKISTQSYTAQLTTVELANHYIATKNKAANMPDSMNIEILQTPELEITTESNQIIFYQLSTATKSNLIGPERHYAFCSPSQGTTSLGCRASFETPLANSHTMSFNLTRIKDGKVQSVITTPELQAQGGAFTIHGLTSGQYNWQLSYLATQENTTDIPRTTIRQTGSFELITLEAQTP